MLNRIIFPIFVQIHRPIWKKWFTLNSASTQSQSSKNQRLVKELDKLATIYKSTNDKWRAYAYQKAISALKRHPVEITSPSQAGKIPGLGPKMITKIIGDVQVL